MSDTKCEICGCGLGHHPTCSNRPSFSQLQGHCAIEVYDGAFWLTIEKGLMFGEAEERRKAYIGHYEKTRVVAIQTKESR